MNMSTFCYETQRELTLQECRLIRTGNADPYSLLGCAGCEFQEFLEVPVTKEKELPMTAPNTKQPSASNSHKKAGYAEITFTLPEDQKEALKAIADDEMRPLVFQMRYIVKKFLESRKVEGV